MPLQLFALIPEPNKILEECSALELDLLMSELLSAREYFLELNKYDFRYWLIVYDGILQNNGSNLSEYIALAKIHRLIPQIESERNAGLAKSVFAMTLFGFEKYEEEILSKLRLKKINISETVPIEDLSSYKELGSLPLSEHVNYIMSASSSQALLIGHEIAKTCIIYIKKIVSLTENTENELIGWDFANSILGYASGLIHLERDSPKLVGIKDNPKGYFSHIMETLQKFYDIAELAIGLQDNIHPMFPQLLMGRLHSEYLGIGSQPAKIIEEQIEILGLKNYIDNVLDLVNREYLIFQEIRDQLIQVIKPHFESKETPDLVPYMKEMYRPSEIARSFYKVRSIDLTEIRTQMAYFNGFANELSELFPNNNWDVFYPGSGSLLKGKCIMESIMACKPKGEVTLHSIELSEGMRELALGLAKKYGIEYISHANDLDSLTSTQFKEMGTENHARVTFIGGNLISNIRDPKSFIGNLIYDSDAPQVLVFEFDEEKLAIDYSHKRLMPIKFMQRFFGLPEEMLKTRDYITPEGTLEIYGSIDLVSGILPDKYHLRIDANGQYIELDLNGSNIKVYHGQEMKLIESRPSAPSEMIALMGSFGFKTSEKLISKRDNHVSMAFYKTSSSSS